MEKLLTIRKFFASASASVDPLSTARMRPGGCPFAKSVARRASLRAMAWQEDLIVSGRADASLSNLPQNASRCPAAPLEVLRPRRDGKRGALPSM